MLFINLRTTVTWKEGKRNLFVHPTQLRQLISPVNKLMICESTTHNYSPDK
jgi:hypothetical protein